MILGFLACWPRCLLVLLPAMSAPLALPVAAQESAPPADTREKPREFLDTLSDTALVADRDAIAGAEAVWSEVDRLNGELEGQGRVLLRPSGTEPLVRVMAEAPSGERAQEICDSLADLVRAELG